MRIKDREFLNSFYHKNCIVCGSGFGIHGHHLQSKGSGLGHDVEWNVMPVCQEHHNEFHTKGLKYMSENTSNVMRFLIDNNWGICPLRGKWVHDD